VRRCPFVIVLLHSVHFVHSVRSVFVESVDERSLDTHGSCDCILRHLQIA